MNNLAKEKTKTPSTRDAFLDGKFEVLQMAGSGHRSGLDAILLAATLPVDISGKLADLGAGSGVAGIAAISLRPELNVQLVEDNPHLADLAYQSSKLATNAKMKHRIEVLQADVTLSGLKRENAGLHDNSFDFVIMNPPYNDIASNRTSTDVLKAEAHMMGEGGLDAWMRTATTILKPRGMLAMIYRASSIGQIIAATQGRFGGLTIIPIHSRINEPAKRLLIRATKGSRAPIVFAPPIVIHQNDGSFTPTADAILKGKQTLFIT